MAASVSGLTEKLESLIQGLETTKVTGNRCNTAAAVKTLAQNLQTVNEALEGLPVCHHKSEMAAALASLMQNFQTVSEAIEEISIFDLKLNMDAAVPNLAENFQSVSKALEKEKKHLFQRVQIFKEEADKKIEKEQMATKLIMEKAKATCRKLEDTKSEIRLMILEDKKTNELNRKRALALMGADYFEQFAETESTKATQFSQVSPRKSPRHSFADQ